MIHFVSDTHFNHANIILYANRPFANVDDMNEALIQNWNRMVRPNDTVYHLGDFAYGTNDEVRKLRFRLNGKIHLIMGNHDYQNKTQRLDCFSSIHDILEVKWNHQRFFLCHYPMLSWAGSPKPDKAGMVQHSGSIQLFGHTHQYMPVILGQDGKPNQINVCVEQIGYQPISIEALMEVYR